MNIKVSTEGYEILTSGSVFIQKNKTLEFNIEDLIYRISFENDKKRAGETTDEIDNEYKIMNIKFYLDNDVLSTSTGFVNIGYVNKLTIYINLTINGSFANGGKAVQYTLAKKEGRRDGNQ